MNDFQRQGLQEIEENEEKMVRIKYFDYCSYSLL
jgi:hypothetical protein